MAFKSTCHTLKVLRREPRGLVYSSYVGCLSNKTSYGITNRNLSTKYQRQWSRTMWLKYGTPTQKLQIQFYHANMLLKPECHRLCSHTNIIHKCEVSTKSQSKASSQADDLWDDKNIAEIKESILKYKSGTFHHYIFEKETAKKVVDCLEPHLQPSVPFLECNAGPGLISQELLGRGVQQLTVTQGHEQFLPFTQELCDNSNGKMSHYPFKMNILTSHKSYVKHDFLKHVQPKQWKTGIPLQVFNIICQSKVAFTQQQFLHHLINCAVTEESIYSLGRTQTFLLISDYMLKAIRGEQSDTHPKVIFFTRGLRILLSVIFEIDEIGEFKSDDFFPPLTTASSNKNVRGRDQSLYLIKMTPKLDLFDMLPHSTIVKLPMFVHHILSGKTFNRVIPELEKWVPGCGIDLIANGFTMMELLRDITPEQVITALKVLISAKGYPGSYLSTITLDDIYHVYFKTAPIVLQNTSSYAKTLSWQPTVDCKDAIES